jgi:Ca2+-transporting ATPase
MLVFPAGSCGHGLSATEAARRLAEDGPNALPGGQRRSLLSIAADTLREPMFLLLLAAGTLYLTFGDLQEGLTLFGFVVVTLGLTLYQEGKTERAIDALRDITSPRALEHSSTACTTQRGAAPYQCDRPMLHDGTVLQRAYLSFAKLMAVAI